MQLCTIVRILYVRHSLHPLTVCNVATPLEEEMIVEKNQCLWLKVMSNLYYLLIVDAFKYMC